MNGREAARSEPPLTAVEVAGFKSAARPVRVNLRDITILAGANSSGKSTVMQPLLMIKQTMEKPFDPGGLAIDGPLVKFTHADQFFSHVKPKATSQTFSLMLEWGKERTRLSYARIDSGGVGATEAVFTANGKECKWLYGQPLEEEEFINQGFGHSEEDNYNEIIIRRTRAVLEAEVLFMGSHMFNEYLPSYAVIDKIQSMIYLPGLRGNPERHYAVSASGPQYPGNFNDYAASVIHQWNLTKDVRLALLASNLSHLNLTSHVATKAVDDTRVEVRVGRLPTTARGNARDTVSIADVGFGVSQTLPVLVAFLAAAPGQMVFVEQPELHLHPRAQVAMADLIVQAAQRGARVIIETHSSLLILALQAAIAKGDIAPDRVSLNWFTRDGAGQTHVAEAQLAEDGSYGDWPVDFDAIELDLQDRYMTLVDRRRAQK